MVAGLISIPLTFWIATPYIFADSALTLRDLAHESRTVDPGHDGLSPLGNLGWYLAKAIPNAITWPQALLAIFGAALVIAHRKKRVLPLLPLTFILAFLIGISILALHWERWVIPILPALSLLAGYALFHCAKFFASYTVSAEKVLFPERSPPSAHWRRRTESKGFPWIVAWSSTSSDTIHERYIFAVLLLILSALPLWRTILLDLASAKPSTRIAAREWIFKNVPPGSRVAAEFYTAPLAGSDLNVSSAFSLVTGSHTDVANFLDLGAGGDFYAPLAKAIATKRERRIEDFTKEDFQYLVVNEFVAAQYKREPHRYAAEVAFYDELARHGAPLKRFTPRYRCPAVEATVGCGGAVISVYELPNL